jgi:hypothetical protein
VLKNWDDVLTQLWAGPQVHYTVYCPLLFTVCGEETDFLDLLVASSPFLVKLPTPSLGRKMWGEKCVRLAVL